MVRVILNSVLLIGMFSGIVRGFAADLSVGVHSTPLVFDPIFPASPMGQHGASVAFNFDPYVARLGMGTGDALNDAVNLGPSLEYYFLGSFGAAVGGSLHYVKDYQKVRFETENGHEPGNSLYRVGDGADYATGVNFHAALTGRTFLNENVRAVFSAGYSRELVVFKRNSRPLEKVQVQNRCGGANPPHVCKTRTPSERLDTIFATVGFEYVFGRN